MSINTDEVNFLVYRYLEESGFHHSAYLFGFESSVVNAGIDSSLIPRGALMSLLQKGILFAEAEVFSMLTENEIDAKFEKAIGSMSLLECTMTDGARLRALEKMRENISRTCSPLPPTTTPVVSTTNVSVLLPISISTDNPVSCETLNSTKGNITPSQCSTIPSTSFSIETNNLPINVTVSHFNSVSNGNLSVDAKRQNSITSLASNLPNSVELKLSNTNAQLQRDREFRAQQSQQNQLNSVSGGLPSRGSYRTPILLGENKNSLTNSYSANMQQYYKQQSSQEICRSTPSSAIETTQFNSSTNGISTTHHLQQQIKSISSENSYSTEFLPSTITAQNIKTDSNYPQIFHSKFVSNGSYTTNTLGGKKAT